MPHPATIHPQPIIENYHAPGLRRVRLLLWQLFNRTPLDQSINQQAEQVAAAAVKMDWPTYKMLKAAHPDLWVKAAKKRALGVANGSFPPQPGQLARYRHLTAWKKKASPRKLLRRNHLANSQMCVLDGRAKTTAAGGEVSVGQLLSISLGIPPREPTPKLLPTVEELATRLAS